MKDPMIDKWWSSKSNYINLGFLAFIFFGCLIRIWVYIDGRGFFLDESNLLRNIYDLNLIDLWGPLKHDQYAPPLLLMDLKLWSLILGINEYSMRITSLIAGLGSIYLFIKISKRYLSGLSLFYVAGMMLSSYLMIRYSTEVKQYSIDVFIALLLLDQLFEYKESKSSIGLVLLCVISILISMPSVFIIFGLGIYLLSNEEDRYVGIKVSVLSFLVFLMYFLLVLKGAASTEQLQLFHDRYFLGTDLSSNYRILLGFFSNIFGKTALPLIFGALSFCVGIFAIYKKEKRLILLFIGPLFALIAASFAHQYSFIPRMTLFILPLIWMLAGMGVDQILRYAKKKNFAFVTGFGVLMTSLLSAWTISPLGTKEWPMEYEEVESVLRKAGLEDSNILLMTKGAVPGFDIYNRVHSNAIIAQVQTIVRPYYQIPRTLDSLLKHHESVIVLDAHTFGRDRKTLSDRMDKDGFTIKEKIEAKKATLWKVNAEGR